LRRVPHHGIGYGILRYLGRDRHLQHEMESLPQPQVSFQYTGQVGSETTPGSSLLALTRRERKMVQYGDHLHLLQPLAERYAEAVRGLIAASREREAGRGLRVVS
jgi:hypothetical protein